RCAGSVCNLRCLEGAEMHVQSINLFHRKSSEMRRTMQPLPRMLGLQLPLWDVRVQPSVLLRWGRRSLAGLQ
ncbi:hypothetical protein BaRGS_00030461, partial [Batillaria attramentaria]